MTLHVVVDTNVWISALQFGGRGKKLLALLNMPRFQVLVYEPILEELAGILWSKFGWRQSRVDSELQQIRSRSRLIKPDPLPPTCRDPDDDRILECAISGGADVIISGDNDLLALHPFRSISILTISSFFSTYAE